MNDTMGGSAVRHAITGILSAMLAVYAAKKGITVGPDAATELTNWVIGVAMVVGGGAASAAGAVFRKVLNEGQ